MRSIALPLTLFLVIPIIPLAASADTIQPDLTTTLTGDGNTIVFPHYGGNIPGMYFPRGFEFFSSPLNVIANGTPGYASLTFFVPEQHFGFDLIAQISDLPPNGDTSLIFTGPILLDPFGVSLNPGTYNLTLVGSDVSHPSGDPYTLTVGPTPVATPEPTSLALFGTGCLLLFSHLRRRLVVRSNGCQKNPPLAHL